MSYAQETINGTVEVVKKDRSAFLMDGNWYNNKFDSVPLEVNSGSAVTVTVKGPFWQKFKTINGGTPSAAGTPTAKATPARGFSKGVFPIPLDDGQRSIIRQNALTNARELYVGALNDDFGALDNAGHAECIIKLARIFESYAAGDIERMNVEAALGIGEE